jgi:transcriptional regulator with AAA-type ATPase domain
MSLIEIDERPILEAISSLSYSNPFLGARIAFEREILGEDFIDDGPVWHRRVDRMDEHPNVDRISERVSDLTKKLRLRLAEGRKPTRQERELYRDLILYFLYYRYEERFLKVIDKNRLAEKCKPADFYREFVADLEHYLALPAARSSEAAEPHHLFAWFFQIRRAFHFIFRFIAGSSMPAARLRAAVWQSIFTHDLRRYQRFLFDRMGDITTLVTGPSGAGKEIVARAIGMSRYIPFDPNDCCFTESYEGSFYPINLSALSPTLIESELFGHRRGAFTGAVSDRTGWFEVCPPLGTVFLDEIGEIELEIQVKLLRVLETRTFQRLGDTKDRKFRGKVIAATNRDLSHEMQEASFRQDLYYRLCSDIIVVPSLHERIAESPDELSILIAFLAERLAGEEVAPQLAREVEAWIDRELGSDYPWPGNVRELAQCVSNVLIRKEYRPVSRVPLDRPRAWAEEFSAGSRSAEEILRRYCTLVYAQSGSYQEAARRLGLDRRTVKAKVDPELLEEIASVSRRSPGP